MMSLIAFWRAHRFSILAWLITILIVAALVVSALWWRNVRAWEPSTIPQPTAIPNQGAPQVVLPLPPVASDQEAISRNLQLNTNIPADLLRYEPIYYVVQRGDAISRIAAKFKISTETILYNNKDVLNDDPHGLKPGMRLLIPPVDGIYHVWQEGDTLEKVAAQYKAKAEGILNFPGNDVDLTNPGFRPGTLVMIPGGSRELIDWSSLAWSQSRGAGTGKNVCGGGRPGSGSFIWPVLGQPHTISGNTFSPGHLGVDMTAQEGDIIMAADHGVVTFAGWSQYGYGNMVQIDHGNGYVTLYAHLTTYFVRMCQVVSRGDQIGTAGNTGNSFGAHLHFEIRYGGASVNPLDYVQ